MATIAENLQILKDSTDAIKLAIIDKGGTVTGGLRSYADAISKISSNKEKKDVTFYDYDGTVLHSYTKDEFLALTSLPKLPTQDGLICQEWNWALEDAKEYVQECGRLNIGATYITDDNKTRLYINLLNDGMSIPLYINQSDDNGVAVEWGDGNSETISGTGNVVFNHTYNEAGSYIISLTVNSGTSALGYDNSYHNVMGSKNTIASGSLYKVEIGSNMSTSAYAFYDCYLLQSVTIPNSVTSIENNTFAYCTSLNSIILPNSVTSIILYAFQYCYSLSSFILPNSITSIGNGTFYSCRSLSSITIPNSITSIEKSVFYLNYSLNSIILPNSVTNIYDTAFSACYSIQYYDFTSYTSIPTLSSISVFKGISSDLKIRVPSALYESWKAATNWSTFADNIVTY